MKSSRQTKCELKITLLLMNPVLGLLAGCEPKWIGCELPADCEEGQMCDLDVSARVGTCVNVDPTGNSGGQQCSTAPEVAGLRSEPLRDQVGTVLAVFNFTQLRYLGPEPCTSDLEMELEITNELSVPFTFEYQVDFVETQNNNLQGQHFGFVNSLPPGATTEQGVVFEPDVNLSYLAIYLYAQ
jgi:hypothetical protein